MEVSAQDARTSDADLLREYGVNRSEAAFDEIVRRHVSMVYHCALRQTYGDEHLADDVTQAVFMALSQRASKLPPQTVLVGWLFTTARYCASVAMRTQRRRQHYEQLAATEKPVAAEVADESWKELVPHLDGALSRLRPGERDAILLKYIQDRPIQEVCAALKLTEDAARKRLQRGVAKMRKYFARKHLTFAVGGIEAMLIAQSKLAAPRAICASITAGSAPPAVASIAHAATRLWPFKFKLIAACVVAVVASATVYTLFPARKAPPIKVGWMVSERTADDHPYDKPGAYDCVTAIHQRFVDPQIDLYAIIEPGTERMPGMAGVLNSNFPAGHVIDGSDANALSKLDVIVCSRDWNMRPQVMSAVLKAVENGTGLLRHLATGISQNEGDDVDVAKINSTDNPTFFIDRDYLDCRVISDHPLLAGIRQTLPDGKLVLHNNANGCSGVVHGTPLIVAQVLDADVVHFSATSPTTAPTDRALFCPMFISQIGKGKVVACQWDSIPKPLADATAGRFYIHCVQWLANRPIE